MDKKADWKSILWIPVTIFIVFMFARGCDLFTPVETPVPTPTFTRATVARTTTPPPPPTTTKTTTTTTTTRTPTLSKLNVHFIDVGQGDSILIDLDDTEVLIDGGDRLPGVTTYLSAYVDGPLEAVIASHVHDENVGGLIDVMGSFEVKKVWHNGDTSTSNTYSDFMSAIDSENAEIGVAASGDVINIGELSFKVISPKNLHETTNNNSLVLYLCYKKVGFLFTGDAEMEAELRMLGSKDIPLPDIDILKVAHHGSYSASTPDFLQALKPEVAIYTAGIGNSLGHPHSVTIKSLTDLGAKVYGTNKDGTVIVATDGDGYEVITNGESLLSGNKDRPLDTTPTQTATPTVLVSELIEKENQSDKVLHQQYAWSYQGEWTWELSIPEEVYNYYRELPRLLTQNYSVYVTHPSDDLYIDRLVEKLEEAAAEAGFSEYETVEFAAAFVQSLPYAYDSVTTSYDEWPRYPIETLVDNGGDCEDTSILLASIIHSMGYGVVLINVPGHMAIGIKGGENVTGTYWEYQGDKYYYLETTNENWRIGQLPDAYKNSSAYIYPMIPVPILSLEWTPMGSEGSYVVVEIKVENLGSATAEDVYVYAGFDAGNDKCWNPETSSTVSIEPGYQYTTTLYIKVPLYKLTRLVVQVCMGGYAVEESYSDWFDTF